MSFELFTTAFVTLFVIADPLGTAAVFGALTGGMSAVQSRQLAARAVLTALLLYAFFAIFGMAILNHMGISMPAFRIAGGLLLFVTAFRMIMGRHDDADLGSDKSVYADRQNLAIFPLAIPLLAGPGCLTALLLLLNRAEGLAEKGTVIFSLLLVQASAFVFFLLAGQIKRLFGTGLMTMVARVMGILLASMAAQFVISAVHDVIGNYG